jgi:hypothetical protein
MARQALPRMMMVSGYWSKLYAGRLRTASVCRSQGYR